MLLGESMPHLKSCAFSLEIPAGVGYESNNQSGIASFTCEMALRGCGRWGSREFMEALQSMGVDRGERVGVGYTSYSAVFPAEYLDPTLEIYASLAHEAHFDPEGLEPSRQSVILERQAIDDDPATIVSLAAKKDFFPEPWGNHPWGEMDVLEQLSLAQIKDFYQKYYRPDGAVLAVAGNFDWNKLQDAAIRFFSNWKPQGRLEIVDKPKPRVNRHIPYDSQQTHIIIGFNGIPYSDPNYYQLWAAISALGGGTSGRLFTEVREKRGLCYAVGASYYSLPRHAGVFCSASTSADRADQTRDCMEREIGTLFEGITESELNRVKIRARSALIMEQEYCASRASNLASDWMNLKQLPTLEQHCARVEQLTPESVNAYLAQHTPSDFQITTLGN